MYVHSPERATTILRDTKFIRMRRAGLSPPLGNPLEPRGNIVVPHQIIWSWYTGRWRAGCYIWYSDEGTGRGPSPPSPLIAVPIVTAHPSTASVPITVLLYNGPLLRGFSVAIKG